ncbi:hypothetical protein A2U01_0099838, partial [Trifolium medium]|nr:hypothetical protein [Trifolium medium]
MSVSYQDFNGILQVDALFCHVTVSFMLHAVLAFVLVRLW